MQQAFNTIQLRFTVHRDDASMHAAGGIEADLFVFASIDGHALTMPDASPVFDLVDAVLSCGLAGEFYPLTCTCGDAGCAGVEYPVEVRHADDAVVWEMPEYFYFAHLRACGLAKGEPGPRQFRFEAVRYRETMEAMRHAVAEALERSPGVRYAPYHSCESLDEAIRLLRAWRRRGTVEITRPQGANDTDK